MVRLVLLLLGIEYLRTRWRGLTVLGWVWVVAGVVIFVDALDGALHFPIQIFAWLFLIEPRRLPWPAAASAGSASCAM